MLYTAVRYIHLSFICHAQMDGLGGRAVDPDSMTMVEVVGAFYPHPWFSVYKLSSHYLLHPPLKLQISFLRVNVKLYLNNLEGTVLKPYLPPWFSAYKLSSHFFWLHPPPQHKVDQALICLGRNGFYWTTYLINHPPRVLNPPLYTYTPCLIHSPQVAHVYTHLVPYCPAS